MSNRVYSQEELRSVLAGFGVKDPTDVSRYGSGHINDTFKVETASGTRYILQRVTDAFDKDILKANIIRVTDYLKSKGVKTLEGRDQVASEFSFELADADGNVVATATNAADGTIDFGSIAFEEE
ncbi:MAG: hypothetical protein IJG13_15580, partial [Kiritimatiellae bacterium]|nr:hypothetical protein [Kiritimatiellia bacterium]